jgi:hypothetical protein
MRRILINEPHPEVGVLLTRMVLRLGHEPVLQTEATPGYLDGVEVLIVEPAAPLGALMAKATRRLDPSLPIVCVSVAGPPQIGVQFSAWLLKPFTQDQLAHAIEHALAGDDVFHSAA